MQIDESVKKYHHGNLYEDLISAGNDLLKLKGASGLSLREVAKNVGVSHTAPYRHFKDKESLLKAIAQKSYDELGEIIKYDIFKIKNEPKKQLIQATVSYITYAVKNPELINLMFGGVVKAKGAFHFSDTDNSCFKIFTEIIETGQAEGVFKAGDAKMFAMGTWSSIHGLSLLITSGQINIDESELASLQRLTTLIQETLMHGMI